MRALQGDLRAEPQRGGGAQPLIMHHGAKAPKADSFFVFFLSAKLTKICPYEVVDSRETCLAMETVSRCIVSVLIFITSLTHV